MKILQNLDSVHCGGEMYSLSSVCAVTTPVFHWCPVGTNGAAEVLGFQPSGRSVVFSAFMELLRECWLNMGE